MMCVFELPTNVPGCFSRTADTVTLANAGFTRKTFNSFHLLGGKFCGIHFPVHLSLTFSKFVFNLWLFCGLDKTKQKKKGLYCEHLNLTKCFFEENTFDTFDCCSINRLFNCFQSCPSSKYCLI